MAKILSFALFCLFSQTVLAGVANKRIVSPYGQGNAKNVAAAQCTSYTVKSGDTCSAIASANKLTLTQLESFNQKTWGFSGCDPIQLGAVICVSSGDPPFPPSRTGVQCGPTVPGTSRPAAGTDWTKLNQCPLNACCSAFGFCGTTSEHCTTSPSNPGTAKPGTAGCISNCGTDIVSGTSPSSFASIAYFEAWNFDRDCLHLDVTAIDKKKYTHIHYAFGDITTDFKISGGSASAQFQKFVGMTGIKRILSFGGWAFSTEAGTSGILPRGMQAANREQLASNIADFIKKYNLDGVDIDWEYPGASDLGISAASANDGVNYLAFLKLLKAKLPGKTVSIAAPASYWYLQKFPIKEIGQVVDYIIYMTYDFHGQWDIGNDSVMPGCKGGNCLFSHVNITDTLGSLAMVTKAGVASSKIMVGVTSYGRGFKMSDPTCGSSRCTFTGTSSRSDATPGRCTRSAGYLANAEIAELAVKNLTRKYKDKQSDSDILIFDKDQWVAYMSEDTKAGRAKQYQALGFGGITDWAVDLQAF